MLKSTVMPSRPDFARHIGKCEIAQPTYAWSAMMMASAMRSNPSRRTRRMPTATPEKIILMAVVIGLGAAAAYLASSGKSSMAHTFISDTARTTRIILPHGMTNTDSSRHFRERTPFPYLVASGALHGNRDLEFEY